MADSLLSQYGILPYREVIRVEIGSREKPAGHFRRPHSCGNLDRRQRSSRHGCGRERKGHDARAAALILVYGLLPLWAAIVYLLVGVARWSSDFLLAAPFAIVLAVRPTGVTLAIALATLAVYRLTPGDPVRKHRFASVTITTLSLIALSWAGIQWQRHQQRETERATERENDMLLAAEFVKSNDVVLREVGGGITRFSIRTWTQDSTGRLLRHEAMLHGKGDVMYAIVEVQRDSAGRPTFFLACTTTIDSGQRDPFKHPCEQTR